MALTKPTQITVPFASSGLKNTIPETATGSNRASMQEGFPAITMQDVDQGGMAPYGQDMNGIIYDVTKAIQYQQAGGFFPYDATFAAAIDGYPIGAIVTSADGTQLFQNTLDGNQSDPENGGANWSNIMTSASLAGKQDKLDQTQMDAVNSGITSAKVAIYDSYASTKQDTLTFDNTPTNGSINPVTSDGIYAALGTKQDTITVDAVPTSGSTNPVQSGGVYDAVQTLETAVDGKVSKSGDTMAGELNVVANYDVNDSTASHIASTSFCTTRRSCFVGQNGNGVTAPWFKVGSFSTTTASRTTVVCLFDIQSILAGDNRHGLLYVKLRLLQNRVIDSVNTTLEWVDAVNTNPDDFVLVFNSDSTTSYFDLYVKCPKSDLKYTFKILSEKSLGNSVSQSVTFALANNVAKGSLASLPAGTQIKSKFKSKAKCGKRIVFTADFKCPDYDELMGKTYQQDTTNRYIWPQAANRFVKDGVEYLFVLSGASLSGTGTGTVTQIVTVYNLDTGEYLGYWLLPNVPTTEGIVVKTESDGDYIYTAKGGNTLQKFKFTLGTYKTTLTGVDVVDPDGNLVPAVWFISYLNGTWCIDGITNRIGGFVSRTLTFYDESFKVIGMYDVQKFEQDVWNAYEGLTAEQQKVQWSIPRTQAISIGTDGIYFYKGGGTNAADTTFPITDCGVDHFNFQGDLVRSSVCRHTPFAARVLSMLGVSSNINHTECEGGFCTEDGRCLWFAVVGAQSGKLVLMEEFSDAPDAVDFSDCLANRQSNIPFQSNTPNFPRTSGGYRNPWTGELISSLDEFIKMCAIWGLDNVFISNYQAGLGTTIASTTVSPEENFGIFVRRYSYNRFFVEVIQNSLRIPRTYVVGVDSDFTVTSCTIQRTFNDGSIVTVVESGTGYKRYSDGTQECWGGGNTSTTPANVNFPKAFSSAPTVTISGETSSVDMQMRFYKAAAVSATGFTPVATNVGATAYSAVTYRYRAIGTWSA